MYIKPAGEVNEISKAPLIGYLILEMTSTCSKKFTSSLHELASMDKINGTPDVIVVFPL